MQTSAVLVVYFLTRTQPVGLRLSVEVWLRRKQETNVLFTLNEHSVLGNIGI